MSTARELIWTWRAVRDNEPVAEEPADGRPIRSALAVWRRGADGLWRADGARDEPGVTFEVLASRVPLREAGSG